MDWLVPTTGAAVGDQRPEAGDSRPVRDRITYHYYSGGARNHAAGPGRLGGMTDFGVLPPGSTRSNTQVRIRAHDSRRGG